MIILILFQMGVFDQQINYRQPFSVQWENDMFYLKW